MFQLAQPDTLNSIVSELKRQGLLGEDEPGGSFRGN